MGNFSVVMTRWMSCGLFSLIETCERENTGMSDGPNPSHTDRTHRGYQISQPFSHCLISFHKVEERLALLEDK